MSAREHDLSRLAAIECERALSHEESARLEAIIRRERKREVWRWSEQEDRQLKALIKRRAIITIKPFARNDEVRLLALSMGRSYFAVHRRIERLRKAAKCSDACKRRKG